MKHNSIKTALTFLFKLLLCSVLIPAQAQTITLNSTAEGGDSSFSAELLASSCAKVGVVMYHGRGSVTTGPVVDEIRKSLNRAGYTTLSIPNPKPLNGLTGFTDYVNDVGSDNYVFPEAYARMRSAINYLQTSGVEQVVVAGFSLGSRLATAHVARGQIDELPIIGLIGVGMYATSIDPLNVATILDEITVPVLDLYGDVDTNAVNTASSRTAAYQGSSYTQTSLTCIAGSNCHQLAGLKGDDSMPFEIELNAWMQSFAPASVVTDCTATTPAPSSSSGGTLNLLFLGVIFMVLALGYRYKKKFSK